MEKDNIVAVASAHGRAGVGIIRISGYNLMSLISKLTNYKSNSIDAKKAIYCDFLASDESVIDSGLLLFFNAPHSFTGEDVIELQGHGSPIVLQMIIEHALQLGCRMASNGEFSKRAYFNGKLDLVQAESIVDLINAESVASAKSAVKSLKGEFSNHINQLNQNLINLRMFVEATLDFPEEDIEFIANNKIKDKLEALKQEIAKLLHNAKQGVLLNDGANVVIVGKPNVGKSSLINRLSQSDVAIVTDIAGTTRDIIKERISLNGIMLNLIDTAGIRETHDPIEKIGIERTLNAINHADLCLVLVDATNDEIPYELLNYIPDNLLRIFIHNKIDLTINHQARIEIIDGNIHIFISALNNLGIDHLQQKILELIGFDNSHSEIFIARTRHLNAIKLAVTHIDFAFDNWGALELVAEELRYAHNKLSEITGEFTSDDLLGEIFSRFCIGK